MSKFGISSKAQSAIEYLMTYGWMLLVVAIVGGAVFSMVGEQNIESINGFNSQDVNVQDFGVSLENGLMFSMNDPIGQTTVTQISVSNPNTIITYIVNQDISEQNMVNLPGITPSNNDNDFEVEITYDSGSLENLSTSGTVTGSLEVGESFNNHTMILDGLVGYWPLSQKYSEGDVVYDLTRNDNSGTMINNPEHVEGVIGTATSFSEETSDEIWLGNDDVLKPSDSITFSAWVKTDTEDGDEARGGIISDGDWGWTGHTERTGVTLKFRDESRVWFTIPQASDGYRYKVGGSIEPFKWHHVAGVAEEDGRVELYIDGALVDDIGGESLDGGIATSAGSIYLGEEVFHITGSIDDARIYDRALSADEVETIYEQGEVQ